MRVSQIWPTLRFDLLLQLVSWNDLDGLIWPGCRFDVRGSILKAPKALHMLKLQHMAQSSLRGRKHPHTWL
jgi:hypothetical protein